MTQTLLICLHEIPPLVICESKENVSRSEFLSFLRHANEVLGKVIFSDASVFLSTGGLCIMLAAWSHVPSMGVWGSLSRGVLCVEEEDVSVQGASV